jgi:aldose 1-epimerase
MAIPTTLSCLHPERFREIVDGKQTDIAVLRNKNGIEVVVLNYGAKIVSILVPDRTGKKIDVVTGHDSISDYLTSAEPFFGATIGRFSNRIAKGRFELDGVVYDKLAINNGSNHLHGGIKGFHAVVWDMKMKDSQTVTLSYTSVDGEEGYPGTLTVTVVYHLTENNEIDISYHAVTDKPTIVNFTNHSFFNLSGAGAPTICDHMLSIVADSYLPTDPTGIPYGRKDPVDGTPMDFRAPHAVGERIDAPFEQLVFGKGYDHTYVLSKTGSDFTTAARCTSLLSGIAVEVLTSEPGIHIYSGNFLTGTCHGKGDQRYPRRSCLCLETQHFPNSPNVPDFPSTVLRPGETFTSRTMYRFSVV